MDTLTLDYQLIPRRSSPLASWLLAIGCFMALMAGLQYNAVQEQLSNLTGELDQLRLTREGNEQRTARSADKHDQSAEITKAKQEIQQRLALPWMPLFKSIENARESKVFLLAIEPNAKTHTVRLTAETDTLPRVLGYLDRLQHQPSIRSATLVEHEIEKDTPGRPVKFTLVLTWSNTL